VLVLQHKQDGTAFSDGDVGVLETFARIAASDVTSQLSFENHRASASKASNDCGILLKATCDLAKPHAVQHILEVVAEAGTELFDCMECVVYLYDEKADVLWRDVSEGELRTTTTVPPGEGTVGTVLQNGLTTRVRSVDAALCRCSVYPPPSLLAPHLPVTCMAAFLPLG
jgi:transcriptional regulator with GAF, ATPase, and Fis domain